MSKLLIDANQYEEITGRSFVDDYDILQQEKIKNSRRCAYCGKRNPFTKDHIIPKSRGGSDRNDNLVWCCMRCNSRKRARTPSEANMPIIYVSESRV